MLNYKVKFIDGLNKIKGSLSVSNDYIIFNPQNGNLKTIKEATYRLVQVGIRKFANIFPYKIYIKTMSGRVLYFETSKAKEIFTVLEKIVYG